MKKPLLHAIAMAFLLALLPGSASANTAPALRANQFVDSIGVNVHLNTNSYTPWATTGGVESLITGLGVRHLRWSFSPISGWVGYNNELMDLEPYGITANLEIGTLTDGTLDQSYISTYLTDAETLTATNGSGVTYLSCMEQMEGPNEYNSSGDPNWQLDLYNYQVAVRTLMKSSTYSAYNNVELLVPPISLSGTTFGEFEACSDVGNGHEYPGMGNGVSGGSPTNPENAVVSEYIYDSQWNWPNLPLQETENGYSTVSSTEGISEATQAKWLPRLLLNNYRLGIERTYIYELLDEALTTDTNNASYYGHNGLVELTSTTGGNHFNPKASYTAIQNMISILADSGGNTFPTDSISYELSGATTNVGELAMEKQDGTFYLALWVASTGTSNVSQSMNVTFANPVSKVTEYIPASSTTGTSLTITGSSVTVNVPDQPLILAVQMTAGTATTGTTDYLANLNMTDGALDSDWAIATPTKGGQWWFGDSTVAYRVTNITSNALVYNYPGINGFTAQFGFGVNAEYANQVSGVFNLLNNVAFYSSTNGTTWSPVTAYAGMLTKTTTLNAGTSGDSFWFQSMSPTSALPAGTDYIKMQVTTTSGTSLPGLFQMDIGQTLGAETAAYAPAGTMVVNSGTWAFSSGTTNANGYSLMLNGNRAGSNSFGVVLYNIGGNVYTVNGAGNWYQWNGSNGWNGTSRPGGIPMEACTVANYNAMTQGTNTWTWGSVGSGGNYNIMLNGGSADSGQAVDLYDLNGTVFMYQAGASKPWSTWNGSAWTGGINTPIH